MTIQVRAVIPSDRVRINAWLAAADLHWPPGQGFVVLAANGSVAAVARLGEPTPGDGHHREHVRTLVAEGEPAALAACVAAAAEHWDGRIEATVTPRSSALREALASAGIKREVTLTRGWSDDDGSLVDLELWGRGRGTDPPEGASPKPAKSRRRTSKARPPIEGIGVGWHRPATRKLLARFLQGLVPGRSYPPGALLSEAERIETGRRGVLDAPWILALARDADGDAEVVGGLAFDREPGLERSHVRRLHLDVAVAWQRRGIAAGMLNLARDGARARLGALVLESDPRAGNIGACSALAAAGFEQVGIQRGAWRMRGAGRSWDEDVILFRCDTK